MTGQSHGDDALNFATTKELTAALAARKISGARTDRSRHRAHRSARRQDQCRGGARFRARPRGGQGRRRGARRAAKRRPLLGIPIVIKESFDVAGLPTTWGVPALKDFVPQEDALMVARVRAAGAMILGKTNVPLRPRRLAELQRHLRHDQQSVGSRPLAGRIVGRIVRRARRRLRAAVARLGYRRLAARAGALLRRLRPQADLEPDPAARAPAARHGPARERSRRGRADGAQRRRSRARARPHRRSRRGARRHRLSAGVAEGASRRAQGFPRAGDRRASAAADRRRGALGARAPRATAGQSRRQGGACQSASSRPRRVGPALHAAADGGVVGALARGDSTSTRKQPPPRSSPTTTACKPNAGAARS